METLVRPAIEVLKTIHQTSSGNKCYILGAFQLCSWTAKPTIEDIDSVNNKLCEKLGPGTMVVHVCKDNIINFPVEDNEANDKPSFKPNKMKIRRT